MFGKKCIILMILLSHTMLAIAKTGAKDTVKSRSKAKDKEEKDEKSGDKKTKGKVVKAQYKKPAELTPEQLEFSKTFFKNLMADQKKKFEYKHNYTLPKKDKEEEDKPLKASAEGEDEDKMVKASAPIQVAPVAVAVRHKTVPSGGTQFLDGLLHNFFPIGDPYGGMPDGILSMGKYCIEFIIKGILGLIYTTVRYPHKILMKTMCVLCALAWLPMNALYCISPISMSNFVAKSKIINRNHDEMAKVQFEWKTRMANALDRVYVLSDLLKMSCCGFVEYKRKSIEATPDEAKEFVASYFGSFWKMQQVVYCGEYQDGSPECEGIEYIDDEPGRILPRSWLTLFIEKFTKFF